jgi:hypothetical protein
MNYVVKLCSQCPYSPNDLGTHYDPCAPWPCCIACDLKSTTAFFPKRRINARRRASQRAFSYDGASVP